MRQRRSRLQKDITYITLSMFLMVAMWIGFNIYNTHVTSTIDATLQTQILPIDGKFDETALTVIGNRKVVQPEYENPLGSGSASRRVVPTTEPTPEIEITPDLPVLPTEEPQPTAISIDDSTLLVEPTTTLP